MFTFIQFLISVKGNWNINFTAGRNVMRCYYNASKSIQVRKCICREARGHLRKAAATTPNLMEVNKGSLLIILYKSLQWTGL